MRTLAIGVLEISFVIALGAAFFVIVEWVATLQFSRWAFRIGPRVMTGTRAIPAPRDGFEPAFDASRGEAKWVAPDAWLFRPQSRGLSLLDAFAIKGSLRWNGDEVVVEERVPLSTTLFLVSWLIGWFAGSVAMMLSGHNVLVGLALAAIVPLTAATVRFVLVPLEVRRADKILDEFADLVGSDGPSRGSGKRKPKE